MIETVAHFPIIETVLLIEFRVMTKDALRIERQTAFGRKVRRDPGALGYSPVQVRQARPA